MLLLEVNFTWDIEDEIEGEIELQILSIDGHRIQKMEEPFLSGQKRIQITSLKEGIYLCRILQKGIYTTTKKLVIIR